MIGSRLRSRTPPRLRGLAALALAAATAALVACGGGSAATPSATAAATVAPAAATPAAATAAPSATADANFPRIVPGSEGTTVTLAKRPERIISFSPGATEILFAVGAGSQVVAVDRYSNYPAEAKLLPQLDTYLDTTDPEKALALAPDLIITSQPEQAKEFRDLGIPTLLRDIPDSLGGVYLDMQAIGAASGHMTAAQALVAQTTERVAAVTRRLSDVQQGPKVFFELDNTLYTAAPQSFVGGMLTLLKAQNVAAGAASAFPQLTAEAVIAADPDVILLADAAYGESEQTVAARPGWSAIAAVVHHRVLPVDADVTNRPGPRIAEAIETLARDLYPDRFPAPAATPGASR